MCVPIHGVQKERKSDQLKLQQHLLSDPTLGRSVTNDFFFDNREIIPYQTQLSNQISYQDYASIREVD